MNPERLDASSEKKASLASGAENMNCTTPSSVTVPSSRKPDLS
jgi:hypothetical protein